MMKNTLPLSAASAALLLIANTSSALDITPLSTEGLYFTDLPVVLSATRLKQSQQDSPVSMTVIDSRMINASGATEVVELMRMVPGFSIGYYTGSEYSVSYHGLVDQYARDLQVLIDGRSVYDPVFGGVSWDDLPIGIDDIERIEVIRGPNAAAFGSNSFAGVINIITKHPSNLALYSIDTTLGSNDTRSVSLRHANTLDRLSYALTLNYDENSGFKSRASDSSDARWINFRSAYELDVDQIIELSAGYSDADRETGFLTDEIQPPREKTHSYHYQQIKWTRNLPNGNQQSLQFYHNFQEVDDNFILPAPVPEELTPLQMGHAFRSHRYDLEYQHNNNLGEGLRLSWGVGLREDAGNSLWTLHSEDKIKRGQARSFLNLEKRFDRLTLNTGGMYEKFERHDALFSPRLALNFHADRSHTFRFSASRAYRMPTIFEDNANMIIFAGEPKFDFLTYLYTSADLKPVRRDAIELGYIGRIPRYNLTLDAKLFREKLSDLINITYNANIEDPIPAPELKTGAEEYINSGSAEIQGFELEMKWQPSKRLFLHGGLSIADIEGFRVRKIDEENNREIQAFEEQTPQKIVSLIGAYKLTDSLSISASHYYTDKIYWLGDGDNIASYHRTDLKLSKKFQTLGTQSEFSLTVQNLGNEYNDFYVNRKKDVPDRNNIWVDRVYLQLKMDLY